MAWRLGPNDTVVRPKLKPYPSWVRDYTRYFFKSFRMSLSKSKAHCGGIVWGLAETLDGRSQRQLLVLVGLCAMLIAGFAERLKAQNLYFPPTTGTVWARQEASLSCYTPAQLTRLDSFLEASKSKAFVLLRDGKIVHERYFGSFGRDSFYVWNSAGKSLTAFLVGMAKQEGRIELDAPTATYLGRGWTSATQAQEDSITVRHQLMMTSGLDDAVMDPDCTAPSCLRYRAPVGTRWAYHNGVYSLLDDVLQNALSESVNLYQARKLRGSTGITGAYFKSGERNIYVSTARSMARFGLLMLAKGSWNGTPILRDTAYYRAMISPSQRINPSYGLLWWLNGQTSFRLPSSQIQFSGTLMPGLAPDAYAALGKDGQIIAVTPSRREVWVRMGESPSGQSGLVAPLLASDIGRYLAGDACLVGLREPAAMRIELSLKPNPAMDRVVVDCACAVASVQVVDALGRVRLSPKPASVASASASSAVEFAVRGLETGSYIVQASCADGRRGAQMLLVDGQ